MASSACWRPPTAGQRQGLGFVAELPDRLSSGERVQSAEVPALPQFRRQPPSAGVTAQGSCGGGSSSSAWVPQQSHQHSFWEEALRHIDAAEARDPSFPSRAAPAAPAAAGGASLEDRWDDLESRISRWAAHRSRAPSTARSLGSGFPRSETAHKASAPPSKSESPVPVQDGKPSAASLGAAHHQGLPSGVAAALEAIAEQLLASSPGGSDAMRGAAAVETVIRNQLAEDDHLSEVQARPLPLPARSPEELPGQRPNVVGSGSQRDVPASAEDILPSPTASELASWREYLQQRQAASESSALAERVESLEHSINSLRQTLERAAVGGSQAPTRAPPRRRVVDPAGASLSLASMALDHDDEEAHSCTYCGLPSDGEASEVMLPASPAVPRRRPPPPAAPSPQITGLERRLLALRRQRVAGTSRSGASSGAGCMAETSRVGVLGGDVVREELARSRQGQRRGPPAAAPPALSQTRRPHWEDGGLSSEGEEAEIARAHDQEWLDWLEDAAKPARGILRWPLDVLSASEDLKRAASAIKA